MSTVQVRRFSRADREQLTALVNAHVQAVVPGVLVPVNTVMSQLERNPGEFIVDPWVTERATLVAEQRGRVVAAAHLLRYGGGGEVGKAYRDTAEINWLLFWRDASFWPDATAAADALMDACLKRLRDWGVDHWHADGALLAPGVYGVPQQWPHVRRLYEQAGFVHDGHTEIVLVATVDDLPRPSPPPVEGMELARAVGINGTRLYGFVGDKIIGYIEVDTNLAQGGRLAHLGGWADVGNLHVDEAYRRRGVATWLLGQAADWLRLARIDRLLEYAWPEEHDLLGLLSRLGFRELTRTARGWHHKANTPHPWEADGSEPPCPPPGP